MLWRALVSCLLVVGLSGSSVPESIAGTYHIGSDVAVCMGIPVTTARLPNTPGMLDPYRGLIIDPVSIGRLSPIVQKFVFYHECGHARVGRDELAADCWSIQHGVENGWLQEQHLTPICMSFSPGVSATHPPRAERCANIRSCFAQSKRINHGRTDTNSD